MTNQVDVLIVGGGLVGSSLAIALEASGLRVLLAEAQHAPTAASPRYGERNLALARASVHGLAALGVWPHARAAATPIERIHVSRAGEFGSLRFNAREHSVDALGWTLPARELGAALGRQLNDCRALQRLAPATLVDLKPNGDGWCARFERPDGDAQDWQAELVVGADGSESSVRRLLGIGVDRFNYAQTVFVATVTPEHAPGGLAFERFSDQGPVALLPLANGTAGLVLTVPNAEAEAVAAFDDQTFLQLAQHRFGHRLGRLRNPGKRHRHKVARIAAQNLVAPHAVLVGNAAQTVHPIGAQGFNLGLRDALTLAEMIETANPGDPRMLAAYAERRAADRDGVMAFSHGLVRLACLPQPLLAPLRSLALMALDTIPPLRQRMALRGMGFRGDPPAAALEHRG